MSSSPKTIFEYGLVGGNAGLVQLLGLCPLLAISHTAVNALGLGLATLLALALTNTAVAAIRRWTGQALRLPVFAVVIAAVASAIELTIHAWLPALHAALGLFLPLIATNCVLMARAEAFAAHNSPRRALLDGLSIGLGFFWLLLAIGIVRELLGTGRIFAGAGRLLFLPWLETKALPGYSGFLLASLPVGAFLLLASLIALRQAWRARPSRKASA